MATSKSDKEYILERLSIMDGITCRPMMGEYLLYYQNVLFGGIYDSRVLVKRVDGNLKYNLPEVIPYQNAKPMYFISDLDNAELTKDIILDTYQSLLKK